MPTAKAYAASSATSPLASTSIPRRAPTDRDVELEILYCGVCHSDLHQVRNEWKALPTVYPCVPGHEIVGRVTQVGSAVTKYQEGDIVGVGCLVDSDHTCPSCEADLEQFCPRAAFTYNSRDKHGTAPVTYGGYSSSIVVDERFVLKVPTNLELAGVAPLLCAGITSYSPIRRWGDIKGKKVGILGLGGLGHMGVKFAHAFGAHTVVLTSSANKKEDALRLGADEVVVTRDPGEMRKHASSFDFILDTVSADHDINTYLNLLKIDGTLTLVGAPDKPMPVAAFGLIFGRKRLAGSLIGGIAETQEMLDFCGEHNITSDVEVIAIQQINEAYDRLVKSDVKYRFSIDMASLKNG
ncbi:NAD(P)-dependent alcohol dehydrogenase [Brevifollis gellanilyticus]|uniref:Alcohol dehydrogenase n=1 Tax=Brevifollis gellanilyticus TaxID=748831 RepID=A0A512MGT2_9BACT|nr:NAD(P)-dependent alcohol dehydrogenase [Brevifollis gellanilyticus]GEP45957.1 alcohol dehydrogenase [Brevifollis gellanilyticus]